MKNGSCLYSPYLEALWRGSYGTRVHAILRSNSLKCHPMGIQGAILSLAPPCCLRHTSFTLPHFPTCGVCPLPSLSGPTPSPGRPSQPHLKRDVTTSQREMPVLKHHPNSPALLTWTGLAVTEAIHALALYPLDLELCMSTLCIHESTQ